LFKPFRPFRENEKRKGQKGFFYQTGIFFMVIGGYTLLVRKFLGVGKAFGYFQYAVKELFVSSLPM